MTTQKLAKPSQSHLRSQMVALLFCTMLAGHATATVSKSLRGVGVFEETRFNGLHHGVSMAGGADAMIFGSKFAERPSDNIVSLTTSALSGSSKTFQCPSHTILDEFHSKASEGRLYYRLPSAQVMTEHKMKMHDFKAFNEFQASLTVHNGSETLACESGANCQVKYKWDHTPIWYYLSSPIMYHGKDVSLYLNPKKAPSYKLEDKMAIDITLEGKRFLTEDYDVNWNLSANHFTSVRGTVRTKQRTLDADFDIWFRVVGNAYMHENYATTCNWDNTDCYSARIYPHIDTVSHSGGSAAGGQQLIITGGDFKDAKQIDVTVDGIPCTVAKYSESEIVCITGPKTLGTSQASYPGQHGLYRTFEGNRQLLTSAEIPQTNKLSNTNSKIQGFYEAPVDGLYQFHMSCDDTCNLKLSTSDPLDPSVADEILNRGEHTSFRNFHYASSHYDPVTDPQGSSNHNIGKVFSLWIRLVGGTKYYMESNFGQGNGDMHWTVGVEIDPDVAVSNHNNLRPARQGMFVHQDLQRDTSKLIVRSADGGTFRLLMLKENQEYFKSDLINAGCSADTLKKRIAGYYKGNHWGEPGVTLECGKSDATLTSDCSEPDVVEHIYTIKVNKSIAIPSQLNVFVYFNTTTADVEWIYSNDLTATGVQISNAPLTGKYVIECYDIAGNPYHTNELVVESHNHAHIYDNLVQACPWLRDNVSVWSGWSYDHNVDGLDFILRFHGVKGPMAQYKIVSSFDKPIEGANPVIENVIYDEYGPNIYYDVIPFEQIYTYDTAPPIIATIDGMPILCKSTHCSYTYSDLASLITGFTAAGTTVTIDGTDLPLEADITGVSIARQACTISSSTANQIICELVNPLTAGEWLPEVLTAEGLVAIDPTILKYLESLEVNTLSQDIFYEEGGEILTIDGKGFPCDLNTDDEVSVTFSDGTKCVITSSSCTQLQCKVEEFVTEVVRRQLQTSIQLTLNVSVNDEISESDVTLEAARLKLESVTPSSVSPIIAQLLTLELSDSYDSADMELDTFYVGLVGLKPDQARPNGDMVRWLNVVDFDKAAKTITVKYGGAYSGKYKWILESEQQGAFRTNGKYEVKFEFSDFNPKQGSKYGGQLMTIDGGHFSDDPLKNPIKIGYEYISGVVHYCDIITSSDAQITCRMRLDYDRKAGVQEMIVFASTFEEAECTAATCDFTFLETDTLATLENKIVSYDATSGKYIIEVNGYNISDVSPDTVQAYIGGVEQTVQSVTSTQILIQVDDVKSGQESQTFELYLQDGAVNGFAELYLEGLVLDPEFKGLHSSSVSSFGSTITAGVAGLGAEDGDVTIATLDGDSICESAKMISYGVLECRTTSTRTFNADEVKLMVKNVAYSCNSEFECFIQTFTNDQPSYSAPNLDDDYTISLMGSNLGLIGYQSCTMTFGGVEADDCFIDNTGFAFGDFYLGVPSTAQQESPQLVLFAEENGFFVDHNVSYDPADGIDLPYDASGTYQSISCSFKGGCYFELPVQGLAANVFGGLKTVTACGNVAQLDSDYSDALKGVFMAPAIETVASETAAGRNDPQLIVPTGTFGSSPELANALFDGLNVPGLTGTSANCYAGVTFGYLKTGIIEEVRFFMDYFNDKYDRYDGLLIFQGSNDDFVTTVDIFTVGAEIHEGWNSYKVNKSNFLSYRLFNSAQNGCNNIGELKLYGKEVLDNDDSIIFCTVEILDTVTGGYSSVSQEITYELSLTSYVTNVLPRYGSVEGGTLITIEGIDFNTNVPSDVTVLIDGVACQVNLANAFLIQCVTGPRPGLYLTPPTFEVHIAGRGRSDVGTNIFRYMSLWSESSTWGGQFAPVDGESVVVPAGLNLLVDINSTPMLNMVLVDGGSIVIPSDYDSAHERKFDAKIIMVNDGVFEAGTEKNPYSSKLTITLHGVKYDPTVPIYGNKVLGVRNSILDLHGLKRDSWTMLDETAAAGASQIVVQGEVDWVAGETIMIASTSFDRHEAEERVIDSVLSQTNLSGAKVTTIVLTEQLAFEHSGTVIDFGGPGVDTVEMRAEVALLERNVIFQGDEDSLRNEYGAHILIHAPGDNANIGRISNVQLQNVGQFGQLGRYPIHFHMDGIVHESYIENNVILNSVNRGTTLHGVEYLRIIRNVYYNCKGHTIFVEDGVETKNRVEYNLVINTEPSFSLLNTDSTPACYWLTNPDNILIGNHCAGSEHYGFWYDLVERPTGPSVTNSRCPINEKLGRFTGNVAHSMPNYGLRIFHGHSPRSKPCSGISDTNPTIQAYYEEFLAYRAGRNGVIGGNFGAVTLRKIQTVDNGLAGIEYEKVIGVSEGTAMVEDSMVVGRSTVNWDGGSRSPHGIISPRTDKSVFSNIRFYNFDFNQAAAIGTCSHCYSKPSTDSDARTVKTEQLAFTNVERRVRYQYPFRGIINDLDGTLTGLGADSWATAFWQHNAAQPECQTSAADQAIYDGLLCDPSVEVRRIVIYGYEPGSLKSRNLYLLPYDDSIIENMTENEIIAYEADTNNYSVVEFREKANPSNHWCVPYVTGKRYYARWEQGLDFTKMKFEIISWLWDEDDLDIEFEMPFYDVREAVYVDDNQGTRYDNNTIPDGINAPKITDMGDNLIRNDTETRRINFRMNGDNHDINRLTLTGIRCIGGCKQDVPDDLPLEDRIRRWSVLDDWDTRTELPQDGEEITIPSNWQMLYDIPDDNNVPVLKSLEVNGRLSFEPGMDRRLKAYNLWVRAGELNIGSPEDPFPNKAIIELQGDNTEEYWAFFKAIEAGNKNLVITGTVNMYGMQRDQRSRLRRSVYRGMSNIVVETGLDWQVGEQLVLAPTNMRTLDTDICTIRSHNDLTGEITCQETLQGFHFGTELSTESTYEVDMRGEVALLARNIEITASQHDISHTAREPWGCRILVSDFFENNLEMTLRAGVLQMDNVSVYKCSQKHTWKSAIKFENAIMGGSTAMMRRQLQEATTPGSKVSNSAIHQGRGPGIIVKKSSNIILQNNVIADFAEHGVWVQNSQSITIDGNWVFHVIEHVGKEPAMFEYLGWKGGFTLSEFNKQMRVTDNIVAGTWHHGFHIVPQRCNNDDGNFIFRRNLAHSISGYGVIGKNVANDCTQIKNFSAYKVTEAAIMLGGPSGINRGKNIKAIDTRYGIGVFSAGGGDAQILDSQVYGELTDNMDCPQGSPCDHCVDARGIILNQNAEGGHKDEEPDWEMLPLFAKAGAMRGGRSKYRNVRLINFTSATKTCGSRQAAIMPFLSPDYTPYAELTGLTFDNVAREALTYIQDPPQGWANLSDCVEFTCTGMYNIVMHFDQTSATGLNNPMVPGRFTIISDNKESVSAQAIPTCEIVRQWNAWICETDNIGVMMFDNLDPDRMDRALHPVYIQNADLGFNNRLNSYMDHCWDGFYTCQKRESRFPTLVWQERDYNIEFTGTPPQKQEFKLMGRIGSPGFVVTIKYNAAGAYQLYDGERNQILPTDWDSRAGTWAEPRGRYCGEWRYEGVINRLQFYIENFEQNGCSIFIYPRDAVMLSIRLEFTMDEFFSKGGVVTFADRMAGVLGIHAADIKVVSVYEGSTIIEFQVLQRDEQDVESEEVDMIDLKKIDSDYRDFIQNESHLMESRILDAKIEGVPILTPYQQEQANNFDWNKFEEGVLEQEAKHQTTDDQTKESNNNKATTTKVVTNEDGTKAVVTVDEEGQIVTKMREIIIEQSASPVDESSAYLILCIVVLIAIVAIIGIICVIKKCGGEKNMRNVAETVQHNVKGQPVKGDFHDIGNNVQEPQEDEQYRPNTNDVHLVGTVAASRVGVPHASSETATQNTVPDTCRDLLSERDVAPIRLEDEMVDGAGAQHERSLAHQINSNNQQQMQQQQRIRSADAQMQYY